MSAHASSSAIATNARLGHLATEEVTIHPSYLLRIQDEADKAAEYTRFVADLRACAEALG